MKNPFIGPWRISWMSDWDQDYVDMDVPGHFTFGMAGKLTARAVAWRKSDIEVLIQSIGAK